MKRTEAVPESSTLSLTRTLTFDGDVDVDTILDLVRGLRAMWTEMT
jgi:hypothetical protein